jgi:hypothetical protein
VPRESSGDGDVFGGAVRAGEAVRVAAGAALS